MKKIITDQLNNNMRKHTNCLMCGNELSGNVRKKFCDNICKCSYNNYHANGGKGYQSYEQQQIRGQERKKQFVELAGGKCQKCGYNKCLRSLTFHHIDPTTKLFGLDIRSLSNRTYDKCLEEVKKCNLLCFNCHMELHEQEELDKVGATGLEPVTSGL